MADALFNVVAQGRLLEGFEREQVLLQLQQQLRLPPVKAQRLLGGKPVLVKQALTHDQARNYLNRLSTLGIETTLQAATHNTQPETHPQFFNTGISLPRSARFEASRWKATFQTLSIALLYLGVSFAGCGVLLCYLWSFAYLLIAPPVLFSATVYLLSLFILALICALLSRPWLTSKRDVRPSLTNDANALRRFVSQLCATIAVPAPDGIQIDSSADITLTPRPGKKNLKSAAYTLTLGMSLLRCLSTAQLAALLAEHLGPRARPAAVRHQMFTTGLKRRLRDCTGNEDIVGQRINRLLARRHNPFITLLCVPLRHSLQLSTRFYQHGATLLARIEDDFSKARDIEGQRYLTAVAGNATPLLTHSWRTLKQAHASALQQNFDELENTGIADDLPALVRHYYLNADFHHAQSEQRVDPEHQPGITETGSNPADTLLENPQALTLATTQIYYRRLGIPDTHPRQTEEHMVIAAGERAQRHRGAAVYFNGWFHPHRFWRLPELALIRTLPLRDAAQQLNVCVNEIRRLTPDRQAQLADYTRLLQQLQELQLGQRILAAGLPFQFRLTQYDTNALPFALEQRQQQLQLTLQKLAAQEAIMGGRIALGLRLCGQEIDVLHQTLVDLQNLDARLQKLELDTTLLEQLTQRPERRHKQAVAHLENKIDETLEGLWHKLEKLVNPLGGRHRFLSGAIQAASAPNEQTATRARSVLRELRIINERLAQHAADYGATAEEAYKIERIKLIASD